LVLVDYLPLFAAIKDRPVLVVGTGEIADRKIAFLHRAGAQVRVVAEADFDESHIDSVVLVIAATENRELNRGSPAAQARYRLVNVVDDQPLCSFIFPSIVDRSPLLVAISSGGTAPVLARVLREKLKRCCPQASGVWPRKPVTGATI
jgi:uroporphyrin-III C-methyltransferase/precorrin-2 dehydrogenase/sirohydrochlorin ferrochelatase